MRRNVDRLMELIRREQIDIVHARSRAPAWSAFAATRRTGRHFVTTFHNAYGTESWLKRRYNAVMARGERVIAISHFVAEHAASVYGVPAERLRIIERGVDFNRFDPERVSAERVIHLAREWRLPDGLPVVMLPGRLTRWKGHLVLVDAIAGSVATDLRCCLRRLGQEAVIGASSIDDHRAARPQRCVSDRRRLPRHARRLHARRCRRLRLDAAGRFRPRHRRGARRWAVR